MSCGRKLLFLAALLFERFFVVAAVRPAAPGEAGHLLPTTDSERSAVGSCLKAKQTPESRFDFELDYEAAVNFNPYTTYALHRSGDCRSPVTNVSVTIFPILNSKDPQQTKAAVVIGDSLLLYPNLWGRLYICGALREGDVEPQCFCEVNIRSLNHEKPLRRWMLEWPLESSNIIPEFLLTTLASALESKLETFSSEQVHKPRNIREMRLSLLRVLEDVDQTYEGLCPFAHRLFDQIYLCMSIVYLTLIASLMFRLRRMPKPWYPCTEQAESANSLKVDGPGKLCKSWCLEAVAFVGFILALQGVGIRFISDPRLMPCVIGITLTVAFLEICRLFQCFCQAQLVQAALSRGLYVEWTCSSFASSGFTALVDDAGAVLAVVMVCVMILACAASNGYAEGMLYAAGMAIWPTAMGIAKSIAFLREKDGSLQKSLVPASIPELFDVLQKDPSSAHSLSGTLDRALCTEQILAIKMRTFLSCCRQNENPVKEGVDIQTFLANRGQEDVEGHSSFRVFRDMPWHGRVVYRLTGSPAAWFNPLILFLLLAAVLTISLARLSIAMCTPPALGHMGPIEGMLAPNFTKTRVRYAWLHSGYLDEVALLFGSPSTVSLASPSVPADGRLWKQRRGQQTSWRVESNQFGLWNKTYLLEELPMQLVPTTLWFRYGDYQQCLWFSTLNDLGEAQISVPSNSLPNETRQLLEIAVSFREVTLTVPVPDARMIDKVNASSKDPFYTVCWPRTHESCDRSCSLNPRCVLSHRVARGCCFLWADVRDTNACFRESRRVPLEERCVTLSGMGTDAGRMVQGKAKLHVRHQEDEAEHIIKQGQNSTRWNSLQWEFNITRDSLEGHELKLYKLGEEGNPTAYGHLRFSLGTPVVSDLMVLVERNEQDEEDVLADVVTDKGSLQLQLSPNSSLFRTTEGWRTVHVIPLAADHSVTYDLRCPETACHTGQCDAKRMVTSCDSLGQPEQKLLRQRCTDTQLASWYEVCGGPLPAQALTVLVNLLKATTRDLIVLQPANPRFQASRNDITIHADFKDELLNKACQVPMDGDPNDTILEVDLACLIFQSPCNHVELVYHDQQHRGRLSSVAEVKAVLEDRPFAMAKFGFCAAESCFPKGDVDLPSLLDFADVSQVDRANGGNFSSNASVLAAEVIRRHLQRYPASVGTVLLEEALEEGSATLVQIVVSRILEGSATAFSAGASLHDKLLSLLKLGSVASSKKLLRALQWYSSSSFRHSQFDYNEVCNSIVSALVTSGADSHFGKVLAGLAASSDKLFAPTSWVVTLATAPGLPTAFKLLKNASSLSTLRLEKFRVQSLKDQDSLESLLGQQLPPAVSILSLPHADLYLNHWFFEPGNAINSILDAVRNHSQIQSVELHHLTPPHPSSFREDRTEASENISQLLSLSMDHPTLNRSLAIRSYAKSLQVWWQGARLRMLDISGLTVGPFKKGVKLAKRLLRFTQKQLTLQEMSFSCTALIDVGDQARHKCNCNEEVLILLLQRAPQLRRLSYSLDVDPLIEDTLLEVFDPGDSADLRLGASELDQDQYVWVRLSRDYRACRSEGGIQKQAEAIFTHGHLSNVSLGGYGYHLVQQVKKPSNVSALQVQLQFPDGPNSTEATKLLQHVAEHFPNLKFLTLVDSGLNRSICAAAPSLSDRCVVKS